MRAEDITGQRFGRLVAVSRAENESFSRAKWLCRCDCGNIKIVRANGLKTGNTQSCGCLQKDRAADANRTHGYSFTGTHRSYGSMITRCTNSEVPSFKNYGGRGITVCDRWLESFENFLADMGERPDGTSLERNDVNGNYELSNCRWATRYEQNNNKRSCLYVELNGERLNVTQWCTKLNLNVNTIRQRIKKGWSPYDAIVKPIQVEKSHG